MHVPLSLTSFLLFVIVVITVCSLGKVIAEKCGLLHFNYIFCFISGIILYDIVVLITTRWQIDLALNSLTRSAFPAVKELLCMPAIFFYIGYSIDLNIFKHSAVQLLVTGLLFNLIQTILIYLTFVNIHYFKEISDTDLLFISIMCSPHTTTFSKELLKISNVHTIHLEYILICEEFSTTLMALVCYKLLIIWNSVSTGQFFLTLISNTLLDVYGCVVVLIIGIIFRLIGKSSDTSAFVCFVIGAIYLTFFISFVILNCNIEITLIALGITIHYVKDFIKKPIEKHFHNFWIWHYYIMEVVVFFLAGAKTSFRDMKKFNDLLGAIIILFFTYFYRIIIWTIFRPLMMFLLGFRMSKHAMIICITAPYKTALPLLLVFNSVPYGISFTAEIESLVSIFVCLHCLFNCVLFPRFCKYSGLTGFSKRRLFKMSILLKNIIGQKWKAIEYLQNSFTTANSNWEIVNYSTNIDKPNIQSVITTGNTIWKITNENSANYIQKLQKKRENNSKLNESEKEILKNHFYLEHGDKTTHTFNRFGDEEIMLLDCPIRKKSSHDLLLTDHGTEIFLKNKIRKKILEMELISYDRQLEEELITKSVYTTLINKCETPTLDKPWNVKKMKSTNIEFSSLIGCNLRCKRNNLIEPANCFRSSIFNILISPTYKFILTAAIVLDSLSQLLLVFFYYLYRKNIYKFEVQYLQMSDYFCYGFFLGVFISQQIGLGCIQYFQQNIRVIEFIMSIIIRSIEQILLHSNNLQYNILQASEIIIILKLTLILRLIVLKQYFSNFYQYFFRNFWQRKKMKDYEKKYGRAIANDDILPYYDYVFGSTVTGRELKSLWLKRRLFNKMKMGLLNEESNGVEAAMKARHVAMNVLRYSEHYFDELKQQGYVNEYERWLYDRNFNNIIYEIKSLRNVESPLSDNILKDVYWLRGDHTCRNYLLNNAEEIIFQPNECIIDFGEKFSSLYLITSGVVRYIYKPTPESLHTLYLLGMLPNSDYYLHLRFDEVQRDIIAPGNLIGEFGIASKRPYNTRVICKNTVTALKIPFKHIAKQFYNCYFGRVRLEKLWKTIGIRFCIKHFAPHFKMTTSESLVIHLHNGMVPLLDDIKLINIDEDISDVFLIEGSVTDSLTRHQLFAPIYLKALNQTLIVNSERGFRKIPIHILIIPKSGLSRIDIFKSNDAFKNYQRYYKKQSKFEGMTTCIRDRRKTLLIRDFLRKHNKYLVIDFILQINDRRISIPCCLSESKAKRKKKTVKDLHLLIAN